MTMNFAHRGFSEQYPENTMRAFKKAIEAGADGIELDVQLSRDGIPVIIHDEALVRTTGASGYVWDYDLAELKQLDASVGFRRQSCREQTKEAENAEQPDCAEELRIPTLREYLTLAAEHGIVTNIELKTGVNPYPDIEEKVLGMIEEFGLREKIVLSSFNHFSVVHFKKLAPDIACGFLEDCWHIGAATYAAEHGVEYLHPNYHAVTEAYAREAKEQGIGINTWTVNDAQAMKRLIDLGVAGLIGNNPQLTREIIAQKKGNR